MDISSGSFVIFKYNEPIAGWQVTLRLRGKYVVRKRKIMYDMEVTNEAVYSDILSFQGV
jgi:hypothetical protein